MPILSNIETVLIEKGYDNMSLYEKNNLIVSIASAINIEYTQVTDDIILNHHKTLKISILNENCEDAIIEGFTASNGHVYRTNRDDQINMIGQKDELVADMTVEVVPWKTEDEGYYEHPRDEWLTVYKEAFAHKRTQLFKYDSLKKSVLNATTHQEIVDINW